LTKILVGVGLTQLGTIGSGLGRLAAAIAPALGGTQRSAVFALSLVITYLATGFLLGYLWTRFYIGVAFQRAEREVQEELQEVRQHISREFERVAQQQREVQSILALAEVPGAIRLSQEELKPLEERLFRQAEQSDTLMERAQGFASEYERARMEHPHGAGRTLLVTRILSEVN
jgi:ABC-type transport system involved in cytochrome bd biosynthesis fused ATPase/permease subunit